MNVVHATRNLGTTTAHLLKLLVPGGLMFLIETVKRRRWDDMIWGLAEGWWYFDDDFRTHFPLLTLEQWEQLFKKHPNAASVITFPQQPEKRKQTKAGLIIVRPNALETTPVNPLSWIDNSDKDDIQKRQAQISVLQAIESLCSEVFVFKALSLLIVEEGEKREIRTILKRRQNADKPDHETVDFLSSAD